MKTILSLSTMMAFLLTSFSPVDVDFCRKQGIKGNVTLVTGNQMPSPDAPRSGGTGMKTILYVYELTNMSQADQDQGAFYKSLSTRLVKEIETDENGYFKAKLKPGWYSLFVKKGNLFYSNIFDEKSNIHPVEVKKGEWKEENFKADYGATY
ncbi:MAG: carboxypeptidase regulatory-like domain-containing protein [Chitinophagaceae bacterium]|nr:carboxypeptidase regulatory-like domain-containing protein [Chitinophagaceae bacterium]